MLDETGRVVDLRLDWMNAAARAGQPDPAAALGRLASELWPQMVVNGSHADCLRVLTDGQPRSGEFWWTAGESYATGGWEYTAARVGPDRLLWQLHDAGPSVRRLLDSERRTREALDAARALEGVAEELAAALTVDEVLRAVLRAGRTVLGATWTSVALLDDDGWLRYEDGLASAPRVVRRSVPLSAAVPTAETARSGRVTAVADRAALLDRFPAAHALLADDAEQAWLLLPLRTDERTFGVLRCAYETAHADQRQHPAVATLVAQACVALSRVDLLVATAAARDRAASTAELLQRGLLPALPRLHDLELAARYVPRGQGGGAGCEVGGDWYDVVELGAGRVVVVLGDVMGHGVAAAAAMGQLRAAVRAYAQLGLPPGEVLTLLDRLVDDLDGDQCATCLYAEYDAAAGELVVASAGHLPPLVRTADGSAELVAVPPAPPLGCGSGAYDDHRQALEPGALLALYTDGLVECRTRDLDVGLDQLRARLSTPTDGLEELADRLLEGGVGEDDVALLLLRVPEADAGPFAGVDAVLPDDLTAAADARQRVRALGLPEGLRDDAELVVSELVGNALRHARGPITLAVRRSARCLCLEVGDAAGYRPYRRVAGPADEGGRGLQLVEAVASRWGVRPRPGGKVVWAELELA